MKREVAEHGDQTESKPASSSGPKENTGLSWSLFFWSIFTTYIFRKSYQYLIDVLSPIKQCDVGTQPMQEPIIVANLLRLILASDPTTQMVVYVAIQTMKYQVGANRKRRISFWYLLHNSSRSSSTLVLVV